QGSGGTSAWSMPAWGLANLLVPLFRCSRSILGPYFQIDQQWTTSFYPGIIVLALAIFAVVFALRSKSFSVAKQGGAGRMVWFLSGWGVFRILLALGDHCFVYPLLKAIFPPVGFIRYPIKFLALTIFVLPLLAAYAVDWLDASHEQGAEEARRGNIL